MFLILIETFHYNNVVVSIFFLQKLNMLDLVLSFDSCKLQTWPLLVTAKCNNFYTNVSMY